MTDLAKRIASLSPEQRALLTERLRRKREGTRPAAIAPREDRESWPLSYAQQRLWFLQQWDPESAAYTIPAAVRLVGSLDVGAVRGALEQIVRRHELLRMRLGTVRGEPVQRVEPEQELPLPVVDLRDRPLEEARSEAMRLAQEEARRPFALEREAPVRATLLALAEEEHLLLFTLHHIVADGWSVGVLLREFAAAYAAAREGRPSPLPPLTLQYADYAAWQRSWLEGEERERQLGYWRERLRGAPPVLELPADRPRPPVMTYAGAHETFTIPEDLVRAVRALGETEGATPFMSWLAAFQVLLARYAGRDDVVVGTPVANRSRSEIEGLIGLFVNTLVLRTDLAGAAGFREALRRAREAAVGAFAHPDLPFEMLVDELAPGRDLSHPPLFQVMFDYQGAPLGGLQLPGVRAEVVETETATAKVDLLFMLVDEGGDRLRGVWEYNTDLFDRDRMARLTELFLTLVRGLVDEPDRALGEVPLLPPAERRRVVEEWNQTAAPPSGHRTMHEAFAAQAARTPDALAVAAGAGTLTYGELERRANQLAHALRTRGVGPGSLVGLRVDRSIELAVGVLGIWKAGAAYVPIDPAYPAERQRFVLEDSQAPVLVTLERLDEGPVGVEVVVCLDRDRPALEQEPAAAPAASAGPDDPAYVIYTSGSTGRPKGVLIRHRSALNLADALAREIYAPLGDGPLRVSLNAPLAFDASVQQLTALLRGHALVVVPHEVRLDGESFLAWLREQRVDVLDCVPSQLKLLVAAGLFEGQPAPAALIPGGEAIEEALWRALATAPDTESYNVYGPTECTVDATLARVKAWPDAPTIGRPLANVRAYVLDRFGAPAPIGVPGELHLGGAGVGIGYHGRPELTAERFVPDPFVDDPAARLYRTGDLVRWRSNGSLEFLGRMDDQVKLRGFRIELGEIEADLRTHPGVREGVVALREDAPGETRLVGYVVPAEDWAAPNVTELRQHLLERLPEYMVPSAFVSLEELPLTPNGKVDRLALPAPDQARPDLAKAFVAPRSPLEESLAAVWREVLGLERVGVEDNFFELGGDSLRAAVLMNRLQEEVLRERAHVRAIFMAPTIAELARYLEEYYPEAAVRLGGGDGRAAAGLQARLASAVGNGAQDRLGEEDLAAFRALIPALPPRGPEILVPTGKNPPAVFLLSPPRSGSTLLRVMLDGHPRLFGPPELDLLSFNTLAERRAAFDGPNQFWLQGTLRAVMEARGCDAETAEAVMADLEGRGTSVKAFYRLLQDWVGDRLLVDKTPVYPLDPAILARMEEDFADAKYIHLMRQPYSSIYSFIEAKLDGVFFRHPHELSQRALAELVWIASHQHILAFLERIPAERQHRLRFEDLVRQPAEEMEGLCGFLGIDFDPALLDPYAGRRMTDGVRPGAQMVGDFKFYLRSKIDPAAADRWKEVHTVDFLSEPGWTVAEKLGYDRAEGAVRRGAAAVPLRRIPRTGALPLSFAQQRLWVLDQMEPGSALYNIPAAVRLTGRLDVDALDRALALVAERHEVLRTTFPTVDGQPALAVAGQATVSLRVEDLTAVPPEARQETVQARAVEEARRGFDLARGPLLRGVLLRVAPEEHVLVLTIHHIVADGWSVGILIRELGRAYDALVAGTTPELPPLPLQYVDFAAWQRERLTSDVLDRQLAYWKTQLGDAPPLLDLPTDRPRPAVQRFEGETVSFALPEKLSAAVADLAQREGVTLFMTLAAAFQALLHRYSGQDDVCLGTPVATRDRTELEGLIGMLVNTLVLRTDLSGDPTFRVLLHRVKEAALGAFAHQDVPFEMLVDELQPDRALSRSPLFQAMFALQNAPTEPLRLTGLELAPIAAYGGTAKFDLTLAMWEREGRLRGALEYSTALFDRSTIDRMLAHFRRLLEGAVADAGRPLSRLPLLADAERQRLVAEWNRTDMPYDRDRPVHALVAEQAAARPDAVALEEGAATMTYGELDRRAGRLARALVGLGVGPETPVALCVPRSIHLAVGALGALKAGGAYLPLDPTHPPERLAYMIRDAGAPVVLATAEVARRLPETGAAVVRLDDESAWPAGPEELPAPTADGSRLAYVIYTSGSTGEPKGVELEHGGLANLVAWHRASFGVSAEDRALLVAGPGFDASVWELWPYLASGARLAIPDEETRTDPARLVAWLAARRITIGFLPTPLAEAVLRLPWPAETALRTLLTGGDALTMYPPPTAPFQVVNNYGPTEGTVVSTSGRVPIRPDADRPPSIGRPIANTQVYLLDQQRQPVPIGVAGELCVGGASVGRGYRGRPDLTAERFVPDPFAAEPGRRLYRTGDLARYRPDGCIEFLGRADHQVKIRGFRVELGEIDATLIALPQVAEAVTVIRQDAPGVRQLVGYVVPAADAPLDAAALRAALRDRLPEYMVPAAIVELPALPITPNGKIDRAALPAPDGAPDTGVPYVAPSAGAEEALAAVFADVLRLERVGAHDSFFELGGDSILAIQVVSRAAQAGWRVSPKQLFQHPTVAGLAAVAEQGTAIAAEQGAVTGPVPLTPIQRWFFDLDLPEPSHWNQALLLAVAEPLERAPLETAVAALVAHHDALRHRFAPEGDAWTQTAAEPEDSAPVAWEDASGVTDAELAAWITARASAWQRSLDLTQGPLLRVVYVDAGPSREDRLLLVAHHLVVDGVSWRILLEDFRTAYGQATGGDAVRLPRKTTSFQHWARRLAELAEVGLPADEEAYWASASAEPSALPPDHPEGTNRERDAASVTVRLEAEETRALLQQVPAAYGTEVNDALLTSLLLAWAERTGGRTLVVALEGHGREDLFDDVDLSRTVGWFTTLYPLRLDLPSADDLAVTLPAVKEQIRAVPRRGLGYGVWRAGREAPPPEPTIAFNYLGQMDQTLAGTGLRPAPEDVGPSRAPDGPRAHRLLVNGGILGGRLQFELSYSSALHRRETVAGLAEAFLHALRETIAHCTSADTARYTPSDFPDVELSLEELDALTEEIG